MSTTGQTNFQFKNAPFMTALVTWECYNEYFHWKCGEHKGKAETFAVMEWQIQQIVQKLGQPKDFKKYVHERLDAVGVPTDPESPHKAQGCRIGGRLDWVFAQQQALKQQIKGLEEKLAHRDEDWGQTIKACLAEGAPGYPQDLPTPESLHGLQFRIVGVYGQHVRTGRISCATPNFAYAEAQAIERAHPGFFEKTKHFNKPDGSWNSKEAQDVYTAAAYGKSLPEESCSPVFCGHANEMPSGPCPCGPTCYCKTCGNCGTKI